MCHLLGEYLDVIKKDFHKAARIYKSNCDDYNHPRSCHAYGNYALVGKGKEKQSFEVVSVWWVSTLYFTKKNSDCKLQKKKKKIRVICAIIWAWAKKIFPNKIFYMRISS